MQTPRELAQKQVEWSAEYATLSGELGGILSRKAVKWAELRATATSDKSADRAWEATGDGMNETRLRLTLKALEKQMSSARAMLRVMENESRNQF